MKFTPEIVAALQTLKDAAENDFERHRIAVLEKDLTAPPVAEVIDDTHQKFGDWIFYKHGNHYIIHSSIQRFMWQYSYGEIPHDKVYEVHHKDFDPKNNSLDNFQLLTQSEHQKLHKNLIKPVKCICETCGKTFINNRRPSRFCSTSCRNASRWTKEIYKEIRVCSWCGKEFSTDKYHVTKCCSKSCAQKLRSQTRKSNKQ